MDAIRSPIDRNDSGPSVANLQSALELILDRRLIRSLEPPDSPTADELAELGLRLAEERTESDYGPVTRRLVQIIQLQQGLGADLGGVVEERTAAVLNRLLAKLGAFAADEALVVRGRVTFTGGAPAVGYVVRARDRDLRTFQALGREARTDADGRYEIRYAASQAARAEAGGADLVVRVFAPETDRDPDEPLAESPTLFNAPAEAEVDLEVPGDDSRPSEFERHVDAIEPLLVGQTPDRGDLPLAELTEADVDFLAGDTGLERERIAWLGASFGFSRRSVDDCDREVPPAFFYGWFRAGLPDDWDGLTAQPISVLRAAALEAIAAAIIPDELTPRLEASLRNLPSPPRDSLRVAVTMTGLGKRAVATVLRHAGSLTELGNPTVSRLVEDGELSRTDAHRVGLAVVAHELVGGDEATLGAILGAEPARLNGKGLRRARDLAALDAPELERVFADASVTPPEGRTLAAYAEGIAGSIAERFPTEVLLHRVSTVPEGLAASLARVVGATSVRASSANRAATSPVATNGSGRDPLRQLVNLHPGLALDEAIAQATNADAALTTIEERVSWVNRVRELNPDVDLLAVDYLPESPSLAQVKFGRLPQNARAMVVEDLKAYQRIQSLDVGVDSGLKLLAAGYGSASAIARSVPSELAERADLSAAEAASYHARAEDKAIDTALTWFALHDIERDSRVAIRGMLPQPPAYLARLRGYAEQFGATTFCRCEHCQSVLGPAAYFVDCMYFVERHILEPSFGAHGGEEHSLHLRSRRPDLWTLELTCENTTRVVPTLALVIEVLEPFIRKAKRFADNPQLYEALASVDHSIDLPFSRPLQELSLWLGHLDLERREIADALLLTPQSTGLRSRIRLGLLPKQLELFTTGRLGDQSAAALRVASGFYTTWLRVDPNLSTVPDETETRALDPIDALAFARGIASDTETVGDILATGFVNGDAAGAPPSATIELGIGTAGGVQNDTALVRNLTAGRLDRFERFVRLWRHFPWTVKELGYVLEQLLGDGPLATGSTDLEEAVVALARLLNLQEELQVSVEELCALGDEVPSVALRGDESLFEQLFDPPFDPAQLITSSSAVRARLAAALQLDDEDLTRLTDALEPCLGRIRATALGAPVFVRGLWLTKRNLSLLFRYARFARALGLSVAELLQTVALTDAVASRPAAGEQCILTLEDLSAVLEVHRARRAGGLSMTDVALITGTAETDAGRDGPDELAARIVREMDGDGSLQLSAEVFTQVGMTATEASRLIGDNHEPVGGDPALLEPVPGEDAYRLRRDVRPEDVNDWFRFDPEPRPVAVRTVAEEVLKVARGAGEAGFEPDVFVALGLSRAEADAFVDANLFNPAAANERRLFERVPGSATRLRLKELDEIDAIEEFGRLAANVETARTVLAFRARESVTRNYPDVAREIYRIVRHEGAAGFEPSALTGLGLTVVEAEAFVAANLYALGGDNRDPFERAPAGPAGAPVRYRLRAVLGEADAIASFGARAGAGTQDYLATRSILRHRAVELLLRHHAERVLAARASSVTRTSPERTTALLDLALPTSTAERRSLVDALHGGEPSVLARVLARLIRSAELFRHAAFDAETLAFIAAHPDVVPLADPPTIETIRRVALYAGLAGARDAAFEPKAQVADATALRAVMAWPDSIATARIGANDTAAERAAKTARLERLAKTLKSDARRIGDALAHTELPTNPPDARIDELVKLARVLALLHRVGAPAEILRLSVSEDAAELARAGDGVLAAIRGKYADQDALRQRLEPFEDMLRSRTRDALVAYLLNAPDDATTDWRPRFADSNDLYHHFLTDVMVGGCARTSRVVAATTSIQLYVQRVEMNLERSTEEPPVAAHFDARERQAEWRWRKNYQVWVAGRRVFLHPENYLEPGLRDDKTPIFRELEDTLLQQEIGDATVDEAYGRYLIGFEAAARLTIAGACFDAASGALHLFGATHNDPPLFYYRRIDDAKTSPVPSPWQPLALQIPTRHVSPVLFNGRLYVFWLETTTRAVNAFELGASSFKGYRHIVRVRYAMQRADGVWTPPHGLRFLVDGATEEARIVFDPKIEDAAEREEAFSERLDELNRQQPNLEQDDRQAESLEANAYYAFNTAQALRDRQLTPAEQAEQTVFIALADAAASIAGLAGAASSFLGLDGSDAGHEAYLEVLRLPTSAYLTSTLRLHGTDTEEMDRAGVSEGDGHMIEGDGHITAARKVNLLRRRDELWWANEFHRGRHEALVQVNREIAVLKAALAANIVSVLWDRTGRDHEQPLDNYKPDGWEWDRVYPDVQFRSSPSEPARLRLVFVPENALGPGKRVRISNSLSPAVGEVRCYDVDLFNGLLRPVTADGTFSSALRSINVGGGRIALISTSAYRGHEFLVSSAALNGSAPAALYHTLTLLVEPMTNRAVVPPTATVQAVNGDPTSFIVEADGDPVWVVERVYEYVPIRLGTTVVPTLTAAFSQGGAPELLRRQVQTGLAEGTPNVFLTSGQAPAIPVELGVEARNPFARHNAFRGYFEETFLHIPFSLADHQNSQQRFAESQRWYHHLYDPTAADGFVWRYREFRELNRSTDSLRATLTNSTALRAYRADPFNPHAIARLRPGAYQKAIVMKYIDNLLDWGDMLFGRFTMESVNEALLLYVMAADILGPRPTEVGPCGETNGSPQAYEDVSPMLRFYDSGEGSTAEVLIEELELLTVPRSYDRPIKYVATPPRTVTAHHAATASASYALEAGNGSIIAPGGGVGVAVVGDGPGLQGGEPHVEVGSSGFAGPTWKDTNATPLSELYTGNPIGGAATPVLGFAGGGRVTPEPGEPPALAPFDDLEELLRRRKFGGLATPGKKLELADYLLDVKYGLDDAPTTKKLPKPEKLTPPKFKPWELVRSRLVFCIPPNAELTAYWDRVDDRLNKIRSCMDIAGVRRRLELFEPEIDPRMLVRMREAGLSLDDVMNVTSGRLPPYRFTYLIDKAKQHASVVQSFGSQLLSALEKRDAEELTRLRTVHEQNLTRLRSRSMQLEVDAAEETLAGLQNQRGAVQYRQEYFGSLTAAGLLASESKHQQLQQRAAGQRTMAGLTQVVASVLSVIPDVGAPTAMKFGGSQLGAAARAMGESFSAAAAFAEMGASMAGAEGSNRRREQEWRHQAESARRELTSLDRQIKAAEIRRDIALQAQTVHDRSVEQVEEIFDFLRDRFTSFGRFTWLSSELQKLHRMAFISALSMARLAEQAYRFERPDEAAKQGLSGSYWDAGNAGLLAGDRLVLDLQNLERSYTETNYRTLEIEQSFSLARFDPDALSRLRTECECEFEIPEWYFDLTYAGHYRRRIKAVRLTIPCVVGPHINLGATLRLTGSHVRATPSLSSSVAVPLRHVTAIAASMGQSDAGVFELNFRDERYMPFEGAGASSSWQLTLPRAVKPFDYGTISDVILRLSYTAEESSALREAVEGVSGVVSELSRHGITRVLSLRNDFPDAWNQLLEGADEATIEIGEIHVPFLMSAFELEATMVDLLQKKKNSGSYPTVSFDGFSAEDDVDDPPGPDEESGLWRLLRTKADVTFAEPHVVTVEWEAGEPKPDDILLRAVLRTKPPTN